MLFEPRFAGALLFVVLSLNAAASRADSFEECAAYVADTDLSVKMSYQGGMRDLVIHERPDLAVLANLNRDLQVALARSRRNRLIYLLTADPARINTRKGLLAFSNFEWSDADTEELAKSDRQFRALMGEISTLEARSNGHPLWPELRAFSRGSMAKLPKIAAFTQLMQRTREELEKPLQSCPASPG